MPTADPALLSDARIAGAYLAFVASYVVFALGTFPGMKIDRPGAAIIGAVARVALGVVGPREAPSAFLVNDIVCLATTPLRGRIRMSRGMVAGSKARASQTIDAWH